jgi:hypothetical protein
MLPHYRVGVLNRLDFVLIIFLSLICRYSRDFFTYWYYNRMLYKLIKICVRSNSHVRWDPCHNIMVRPQVVDGGVAFQVWRVAANILNKKSRAADKEWSSSLGVGRGANNSSPKEISLLRKFSRNFGPGRSKCH